MSGGAPSRSRHPSQIAAREARAAGAGSRGPAEADADFPVAFAIVKLAKRVRALAAERFAPLGVHPGQDRLLNELWREDGLSQSELIERLGVEAPTVTGTVQRLEREGILRREPDAANRRISRVYLTDRGRELERPVREALQAVERELTGGLAPGDRQRLLELLDELGGDAKLGA